MGEIYFGKYVNLVDFNLTKEQSVQRPIQEDDVKNSIIYTKVTEFYDGNNNILSGIYKSSALSSDRFAIYRQSPYDTTMKYLGTIDGVTDGVKDYGVVSGGQYKYIVQTNPEENNVTIETNYLNVHWGKWSIVSLTYDLENDIYIPDKTIFLFNNNIDVGSISDNLSTIKYDTLSKFGKVMQTEQQYDSGSFSCLFGDFYSMYDITDTKFVIRINSNQSVIVNESVLFLENFINNLLSSNNIQLNLFSSQATTIVSPIYGSTITIEIDSNNSIKLLWRDDLNHVVCYGFVANNNIHAATYNLVSNMSLSYQRKIYCDFYFSRDTDLQSYIYFEQADEYYQYISQWNLLQRRFLYNDNQEKMILWQRFIADRKAKLLKSPKGDMWIVAISNQTTRSTNYNSVTYPTTINFDWQEIIDKDKISILSW